MDGYSFGDTLLEGILFEIRVVDDKLKASTPDDSKEYMDNLNEAKWLKAAEDAADDEEQRLCPKCDYEGVELI